jgi:hypothetical protein
MYKHIIILILAYISIVPSLADDIMLGPYNFTSNLSKNITIQYDDVVTRDPIFGWDYNRSYNAALLSEVDGNEMIIGRIMVEHVVYAGDNQEDFMEIMSLWNYTQHKIISGNYKWYALLQQDGLDSWYVANARLDKTHIINITMLQRDQNGEMLKDILRTFRILDIGK